MKNKIHYKYEYSGINALQTRAEILTGTYKGIIVEFDGSNLSQSFDEHGRVKNIFNFTYTLYKKPEQLKQKKLIGNKNFEEFLSKVLINIIGDRHNDKNEHILLDSAVSNLTLTID